MFNQYFTAYRPAKEPAYRTPNFGGKSPGRFVRQVGNGIGAGLIVMLISSLQLSFDIYNLDGRYRRMLDSYNNMKLIEGATYIVSFLLAYYLIRVAVDIPGSMALPWGDVAPCFSLLAVCLGLGCSFVGAVLTQLLNALLGAATGYAPTMPDIETPKTAVGWVLYFVVIAVLPAILEEIVFRGALLQSLRQFGDRFAVLTSALLFALGHGNLVQGPNTFVMGVLLGCLVVYTGSLKISILIHFCNNFFFSMIGYADELSGGLPGAFYTMFFIGVIVMGVCGFMGMSRRYPGIFPVGETDEPLKGTRKALYLMTAPMMALYVVLCGAMIVLYFAPVR